MNYLKIFLMFVLSLVMSACSQNQPLVNDVDLLANIPLNDGLPVDVNGGVDVDENIDKDIDEEITSDWQIYENEELGIKFKYPEYLGDVLFSLAEGETGLSFSLKFSIIESLEMRGISDDYTAGRAGVFTDTRGFIKENDKYYYRFIGLKPDKYNEIVPIKSVYCLNDEIIVLNEGSFIEEYGMEGPKLNPGKNNLGAILNLKNDKFSGMAILNSDIENFSQEDFIKLLEAFEFID